MGAADVGMERAGAEERTNGPGMALALGFAGFGALVERDGLREGARGLDECPPPPMLVGVADSAWSSPPSSVPVAESRGQPATFRLFSFALKVAARIYGLSLQVRAWRSPDRRSCEDAETGERVTASYSRSALRVHRTAGQRLARSETQ